MEAYKIDAGKIRWAKKRVKEMDLALQEIPEAIADLKNSIKVMKRASEKCYSLPESDVMGSFVLDLEKIEKALEEFNQGWKDDTEAVKAGIDNFNAGVHEGESA